VRSTQSLKMEGKIPLILKLKKEQQKQVARGQDIIVRTLFKVFNDAVLHGGTAIWRCYQGMRFSEDVDVYIPKDEKRINLFFAKLEENGFKALKKKIGENSLYSNFEFNRVNVKFEALFKKVKGNLREYEMVDGNLYDVYTLLPEELIKEKVNAYLKRLKVRDLYDIYFLLRFVKDKSKVRGELERFLKEFKGPVDERDLRGLIIEGIVPPVNKMLNYIQREM